MASLLIVRGPGEGARVERLGDELLIGRDPGGGGASLAVRCVSRRHARVIRRGGRFYLEDLGSRNGTFLGGRAVTGPTRMWGGDRFRVCDTEVAFESPTSRADWLSCTDPGDMLSYLGRSGRLTSRRVRLFAAACCRRVFGLLDEAGARSVEAAERKADAGEARLAGTPTWCGAYGLDREGGQAQDAGRAATAAVEGGAGPPAQACGANRREGERFAHCHLVRDIFGDPFAPPPLTAPSSPFWGDPTVRRLAEAAYVERLLPGGELDRCRLAVLADALEEAGCADPALLGHLRGPGPCVRGCVVVDILLRLS